MDVQLSGDAAEVRIKGPNIQKMPRPFPRLRDDYPFQGVTASPFSFSQPMWLAPHHVDDGYVAMLPRGETEITAEEAAVLKGVFGKNGELPAERLG